MTGTSLPCFPSSFASFAFAKYPYSYTVSSQMRGMGPGKLKSFALSHLTVELCENLSEIAES